MISVLTYLSCAGLQSFKRSQMQILSRSLMQISFTAAISVLIVLALSSLLCAAPPQTGADTYKAKCATCHGADGSGSSPMGQRLKVRDLRSPEVQKQSDEELIAIITKGKPPMPGYGNTLKSDDIH